jgi:methyl-accepting chemotaxis protein
MKGIGTWYVRQRLSTKLVLPSVMVIVLLAAMGCLTYYLVNIQQRMQQTFAGELSSFRHLSFCIEQYSSIQATLYKSVTLAFAGLDAEKISKDLSVKIAKRSQIDSTLRSMATTGSSALRPEDLKTLDSLAASYFKWVDQVAENLDDPGLSASNMTTTERWHSALSEKLSSLLASQESRMNTTSALIEKKLTSMMQLQLVVMLLVAVLTLGISLLNLLLFQSFVKKTRDDAAIIARGDLTHRVHTDSRDELGDLARSIEEMRKVFLDLLQQLKPASTRLTGSSDELMSLSEKLKTNAGVVDNRTELIASAGKQVADRSRQISAEAQSVSHRASESSVSLAEMKKTIEEIARNCAREVEIAQSITRKIEHTRNGMAELDRASREIGTILGIINHLSDNTRLLALNATIEAASAGDAGRGFSVVAQEVKNLAAQSSEAAGQIQQKIAAIQKQTSESLAAVEMMHETIHQFTEISSTIAAAVEEQSATAAEIVNAVNQVSGSSTSLVDGITDVAQRNEQMLNAINDVRGMVTDTTMGAGHTAENSTGIASIASDLNQHINRFTI